MNRVDRYILGLFWGFSVAAILVLVVLFLATDVLSMLVRSSDISGLVLIRYYSYYIPEIIHRMIPICTVVGTVMTIASLNKGS